MKFWILLLFILTFVFQTQSKFDIDDTILYRIDFPGLENEPLGKLPAYSQTSKVDEIQSQNGNSHMDGPIEDPVPTLDEGLEIVEINTRNKENFQCSIPKTELKNLEDNASYNGPTVLSLLKPIFTSKGCAYRIEHYWTYELCHGRYLRQFHEEKAEGKLKVSEYILGRYNEEQFKEDEAMLESEMKQESLRRKSKKLDSTDLPYFEIFMKDGTLCDLTGKPRSAKIKYVCVPLANQEILSLREVSTCEYEIIVTSGILCQHPDYRPVETTENAIVCKPSGTTSLRKPKDLSDIEKQSTINKLKDLLSSEQLSKAVKIEIIPSSSSVLETEEYAAVLELLKSNWNLKIPSNLATNAKLIKEFLSGEHCLKSGSGWWKFEICFGQSVVQFHEGEDEQREKVIRLGRFDEANHLEWIKNHKEKQPRSLSQRKQISHFYSDGDSCPETGIPRQVEVKLKCKPTEQSATLYLLEPKTCEYILGVESQFICDLLPLADDESGLIKAAPDFFTPTDENENFFNDGFQTPITLIKVQIDDDITDTSGSELVPSDEQSETDSEGTEKEEEPKDL